MFDALKKALPEAVKAPLRRFRSATDSRATLLAMLPRAAVGAELGTWKGDFSASLLAVTSPSRLYLVDPWAFDPLHPSRWYGGAVAKSQADMDAIAASVVTRFSSDQRVAVCREASTAFLARQAPNTLDWVYVDGDHSYEAVVNDLTGSWRCIRPGGVLCGDDYDLNPRESFPVRRAVAAFAASIGLAPQLVGDQFLFRRG